MFWTPFKAHSRCQTCLRKLLWQPENTTCQPVGSTGFLPLMEAIIPSTGKLSREHDYYPSQGASWDGVPCAGAVPTYLRTTHLLKLLSSEVCNFIGGDYCRLLECVASSRYGLDASDVNITRLVEMLKSSLL